MKNTYNKNRGSSGRGNYSGNGSNARGNVGRQKMARYLLLMVIMCLLCVGYALLGSCGVQENDSENPDISAPADSVQQVDDLNADDSEVEILYTFKSQKHLDQHFEKHGEDFDYANAQEYLEGANRVIQNPKSLHKLEAEDGDDVYYLEETNEFVIVSTQGFIRTYFCPSAGLAYYNRQ